MVADAVLVEPVSTLKFPANREINREFRQVRPYCTILIANTRENSVAYSEIPYAKEQGNIFEKQGILPSEQGILGCQFGIAAGKAFGTHMSQERPPNENGS